MRESAGETEPEPPTAATVFGPTLDVARRYVALLTGPGVERGLIGPRESTRIWTRHLLNCAVIGEAISAGAQVADVGSGAGLPGIPLALARPDCTVVLVEPLLRRATFLAEVIDDLGLPNCRVVRSRAEDLAPRRVSRAAGAGSGRRSGSRSTRSGSGPRAGSSAAASSGSAAGSGSWSGGPSSDAERPADAEAGAMGADTGAGRIGGQPTETPSTESVRRPSVPPSVPRLPVETDLPRGADSAPDRLLAGTSPSLSVDVVTSRAVASLDVLAGWCVPLLRPGGELLAMKGASAAEEIRASRTALTRLGLTDTRVLTLGAGVVNPPTIVVRAVRR